MITRLFILIISLILSFSMLSHNTPAEAASEETVPIENFNQEFYKKNRLAFELSSSNTDFTIISTPFQRITGSKITGPVKKISIITGPDAGEQTPLKDAPIYLQNTRFLNIHHPEIVRIAGTIARKSDIISAVEQFVYSHITKKTTGIPLLQSQNILKNRSGDCTEHTVLAVALLRSQGIPVRAIVGMVLIPEYQGKHNVFVFHMWAEAWYKNKWVLVDATSPGPKKHERYIAFAVHTLKTEMPLAYLKTISTIQNLKVTATMDNVN